MNKYSKNCKYCGAVLFEYSPEYSRKNPRGLALWEEEARDAHYRRHPGCLAAYRKESHEAWDAYVGRKDMESWILDEVVTGRGGVTPHPFQEVLVIRWDSWCGEAEKAVNPETGELFEIWRTDGKAVFDGGLTNYTTTAKWQGIAIPRQSDEDASFVKEAIAAYKKMRRRVEDALRKGGPRQVKEAAEICGITTFVK